MRSLWFCLFFLVISAQLLSQDDLPFANEVKMLSEKKDFESQEGLYLFVGSSSIRFWLTLKEDYPDYNVINRGFGGSTFEDLINFKEELIFAYQPCKVFIYEGDNDIFKGEKVDDIIFSAKSIASEIKERLPETQIYFLAAKPSVARWDKRALYKEFNYTLQSWASFEDDVHFIDVWTPMCDKTGQVMGDLFIGDNLHMNSKGYDIWKQVITPYVEEIEVMCRVTD